MNPIAKSASLSLAILFTFTGCGGGGGGGSSSTPPANSTPVAINSTNATEVASQVISGGHLADGLSNMVTFKPGTTGTVSHHANYQRIYDLALSKALSGLSSSKTIVSVPVGVASIPANCPGGGTTSTAWNDLNGNGAPDAGESFSATYNNCTDSLSYTDQNGATQTITLVADGSFTFTITALSGDPTIPGTDWSFGMSFAANFTTTISDTAGGSGKDTLNGGASLTASYVNATTVTSGSMSGSSLMDTFSWKDTNGSYGVSFELADFNFANTERTSDNSYNVDIDYTLRDGDIGGSVTVKTDPVFAGIWGNPPTSGTAVISGANGTKITLVANSDGTVTMTVNNDAPQTLSWAALGGW